MTTSRSNPTPRDMERASAWFRDNEDANCRDLDGNQERGVTFTVRNVEALAQVIADERERTLELVADAFVNRVAGRWPDDDENTPEGWERWALMLHGEECADFLDGEEGRDHFLRLFAAIRSGGDHA